MKICQLIRHIIIFIILLLIVILFTKEMYKEFQRWLESDKAFIIYVNPQRKDA